MPGFHKSVQDIGNGEFHELVARFEKHRNFKFVVDRKVKNDDGEDVEYEPGSGIMSQRGEQYAFPANDPAILAEIKEDRKYVKGLKTEPDETYEIPSLNGRKYEWKPHRVELYGITHDKIERIRDDVFSSGRLLRQASIHGASHSIAMLVTLLKEKIPFDYCYYTNLPNEMIDEREYVLYYTRHVLKVPLIVIVPQNTAEEYFYRRQVFPTQFRRWCTDLMKLDPLRRFLKIEYLDQLPKNSSFDMLQFLGMQAFQSPGRAAMSPKPQPSMLSVPQPFKKVPSPTCEVYESGKQMGTIMNINVVNWPVDRGTGQFTGIEDLKDMRARNGRRVMRVFDMLPVFYLSHEDDMAIIRNKKIIRNPNEREFGRHGCLLCPFADWHYYHQLRTTPRYKHLYEECVKRRYAASQQQIEKGDRKEPWMQYGSSNYTNAMAEFGYTKKDPVF